MLSNIFLMAHTKCFFNIIYKKRSITTMPKTRPADAPEQSPYIFLLDKPDKAKIVSIAARKGVPASVIVRDFIKRGLYGGGVA